MGNCIAGQKHPPNFFFVKNINVDRASGQRGLLEVSETELVYTDNSSADKWTWPLRFLRKYGCDGEVFSFEAGRKCPGGEGLYAFSSKRASKIFELVAKNINQGEQQQNGEISPFPSETRPPDLATMSFVQRQQTPPTVLQESNYTNIGQNGIPLAEAEQLASPPPLPPAPPKGQYVPVEFQKPPAEHPAPQPNPANLPTDYTKIDFERTEQMTRDRVQGTLLQDGTSHRTSGSMSLPPTRPHNHRHRRLNTVSSGTSQNRRSSESSFSSQSSLTESSRNLTSPQVVNGHATHPVIGEEPAGATYQNVLLPQQVTVQQNQGMYQNVNVGHGTVNEVFSETRYANMDYPPRHHSIANGNGNITPIKTNGMGTYAEVVPSFRNRATSTPIAQDSYTQLDFPHDRTPTTADSVATPIISSMVPQPSLSGQPLSPDVSSIEVKHRDERDTSSSDLLPPREGLEVIDENKVTYGTLNFPAMKALTETSRAREQELSENNHDSSDRLQDSRDRKISTSHLFKRSHKDKDK